MARTTPVLHFSGRFRFDYPEYNNNPSNQVVPFDPSLPRSDVLALTAGAPERYFQFEFQDVAVRSVTYADGTNHDVGDEALGLTVGLRGLLVDVAPSAIVAVLHAGTMRVGPALRGRTGLAFMSELRPSIFFNDPTGGMQSFGAHFTAGVTASDAIDLPNSRWAQELGTDRSLAVRFFMNRFAAVGAGPFPPDQQRFGDVYGVLCAAEDVDESALRLQGRRLLADPGIQNDARLQQMFSANAEAQYDLLPSSGQVLLHPMECLRFTDTSHGTLTSSNHIERYDVTVAGSQGPEVLGSFVGDHADMLRHGGSYVFSLPAGMDPSGAGGLAIHAVRRSDGASFPVMSEGEVDLDLVSPRGIKLGSGDGEAVTVRVLRNNKPAAGEQVRFGTPRNGRSPIVATFEADEVTSDAAGIASSVLRAMDLNNLGGVSDPATGAGLTALPFDRYAGHYGNAEIANPRRDGGQERREMAVRVVHKFGDGGIPIPAAPTFTEHVLPVLQLVLRYYPWVHCVPSGGGYRQMFDLADYDTVVSRADEILDRLEEDVASFRHMPRSRDFPLGFAELFLRWIDTGMQR